MSDADTRDRDAGPHIHPSAVVAHAARLGRGVHVGPFCVVGPEVELGDGKASGIVDIRAFAEMRRKRAAYETQLHELEIEKTWP